MNIILKICYIFIILGWSNHFYFGDCFYGGFQSLNDPKFMGTIWTTILTNKYWAKNIYFVCFEVGPLSMWQNFFCINKESFTTS